MPKYTFLCPKCGHSKQMHIPRQVHTTVACSTCEDTLMKRQLPTLTGKPDITEVVDRYTGKTVKQDQGKMIKERRDRHYWGVEVPRFVESGTYCLETMLEQGWVWFDDSKQIQVHTKPPHER